MSSARAPLTDTVAKLNARLEQLTAGRAPGETRAEPVARDRAPSIAPEPIEPTIDQVLAEISARQRALEEAPTQPAAPAWQPAAPAWEAASAPMADFASLERQLIHITTQIEALRRPCGVEDSVAALRADLAEIARAVGDALPRRTLEGLQADMQALAARIEQGYGGGAGAMLAITIPYDEKPATPGNGVMIALLAPNKDVVNATYKVALENGATDEGAPGMRSDTFYGAYFRDLDGNKICVFKVVKAV